MAVDFSRAIRIRRSGTTYTYYGLTTAPSHYIAFRSQGAVRYVPLQTSQGTNLRARVANATYYAYGKFNTTVKIQLRVESNKVYYRLTTVSNSAGGTSVATTIKVELIQSDGSTVWNTYTTTLPANTGSKTYNVDMSNITGFIFPAFNKYRVTVTCNGRAVKSSVGTFDNTQVGVQNTFGITYAPW